MNELLKLFFSLSFSGSIIAILLFLLKPIYKHRLSKTWQYYIWLLVIIRLVLPYTFQIPMVGELFHKADDFVAVQMQKPKIIETVPLEKNNEMNTQSVDNVPMQREATTIDVNILLNYMWVLWLGVALALFVRKIVSFCCFVDFIKKGGHQVLDSDVLAIYSEICILAGIKKPLDLYIHKFAPSPMLVGFFCPFIALPDIKREPEELKNIFLHEITHYKRLDIFYKWVIQIAVCLHWFNPLIYFISHEINRNCELSCDEQIMKKLDYDGRRSYGDTLLASLKSPYSRPHTAVSIPLNEDAQLLKERLGAIIKFNRKSKRSIVFSIFLTVLIFCGSAITGVYATSFPSYQNGNDKAKININVEKAPANYTNEHISNGVKEGTDLYAIYAPYGLLHTVNGELYYNKKLVRYFEDRYNNGHGVRVYYSSDSKGTVDLHTTRNQVGAVGQLTGIEAYSKADFDLRTLEFEAEQNKNPDYDVMTYRFRKEEAPDSLKLWIRQCEEGVSDFLTTEQNGRYYIYVRGKNDFGFTISDNNELVHMAIYNIDRTKGEGYALFSVPLYKKFSVAYNGAIKSFVQ